VLSLLTTLIWGLMPIALKRLLDSMDAYTITWYRFLVAGGLLAIPVIRRYDLFAVIRLRGVRTLLLAAIVGLCSNYLLYLLGLNYIPPATAQIVIQVAPIFMLLGSLLFFKEHLATAQWIGFGMLMVGQVLFFNRRLGELSFGVSELTNGVLLVLVSALAWATYALAQKQLLRTFPSGTIMLLIYLSGVVFFLPLTRPAQLFHLNRAEVLLLAFCAVGVLISYSSFAEALKRLEASRVSMVMGLTPLVTVTAMALGAPLLPNLIQPEQFNFLSIVGMVLVVAGSMLVALR
jgi:drug/metabolite transporter (DMT)-like permease